MANEARMSQQEVADQLQLSTRQVSNLVKAGLPQRGENGKRHFLWNDVFPWYVAWKMEEAKRAARPSNMDEAKLRRETAEAEMVELELAERRGELMRVEEGERWLGECFSRVRSKLLNLPHVIAQRVIGLSSNERLSQAQPLVDEVMAELAEGADVPVAT